MFCAGLLNVPASSPLLFFARSTSNLTSLPGAWIAPSQWPEGSAAIWARSEGTGTRNNAASRIVRRGRFIRDLLVLFVTQRFGGMDARGAASRHIRREPVEPHDRQTQPHHPHRGDAADDHVERGDDAHPVELFHRADVVDRLVRIEAADDVAQRRDEARRIARGFGQHDHAWLWPL